VTLEQIARGLLVLGAAIAVLGGVLLLLSRVGRVPHVPGDIVLDRPGLTVYLPLGTSVLLSLILTLAAVLYAHIRR
jgi:hypothetical protein